MTMLRKLLSRRGLISISLSVLALAATIAAFAPERARANENVPFKGTFSVAYSATPNTAGATYCGGSPLDVAVEAHGNGYSTLGALSFSLLKTLQATGPHMHGCLILTAPNGDTLEAVYDGNETAPNANNFSFGSGTLSITGGTGRFKGSSGSAKFTAVFSNLYPASSFIGGTSAPLQGAGFYSVEGAMSSPENEYER
jgi:hypothetical protein